jgi:hypothetical protein
VRIVLLACVFFPLVAAPWQRKVATGKSEWVDLQESHPLAYFTAYPMLRIEGFCGLCTAEDLAEAKKTKAEANLKLVGRLAGFEIYDLYYHFEDRPGPDTKLILVKTGEDQYREIYHREPTQMDALAEPSSFVKAGDDQFLEAVYDDGGNGGDHLRDYFWFDRSGATLVDFTPILVAAKSVLSAGREVLWIYEMEGKIPGTHHLWAPGPLISRVRIEEAGVVTVEFRFDHGKVVPSRTSWDMDAH